jgi:cyclophilin family peptidyl-prolyl cis-trans isomerase
MKNPFFQFFYLPAFIVASALMLSCSSADQFVDKQDSNRDHLTEAAAAVAERNAEKLWELIDHEDVRISDMAWRALIITGVNDLNVLFDYAISHDDARAWYILSFQDTNEDHLNQITRIFSDDEVSADHACKFFSRKGNMNTLELLISDPQRFLEHENCSKAAAGIISRVELEEDAIDKIAGLMYDLDDETAITNLLYGFWRFPENHPDEESSAYKIFTSMVCSRASEPATLADEYLIGMTGKPGFYVMLNRRSTEELHQNVQLAVVTAGVLSRFNPESLNMDYAGKLLSHPNPHVAIRALEALKETGVFNDEQLYKVGELIRVHIDNPEAAITYLELLHQNGADISGWLDELHRIDRDQPYLKDRTLALFQHIYDDNEYLEMLVSNLEEEGIEAMRAAQALERFLKPQSSRETGQLYTARNLLLHALETQNRSVISVSGTMLTNPELFSADDMYHFRSAYDLALERNNRPVAAVLADVVTYFDEQSGSALREVDPKPMRMPDWDILCDQESELFWKLKTEKGEIVVKLYPGEAPFTVTSIIHLTEGGFYDGVTFHRVVRNFVIQGGDFDRRDGFGGPQYRIPTEPSFNSFKKGKAGIASSGPDTEGSQFFITLTRTPHLDGHYTIYGEVVDGMDVVENIQIGDTVLQVDITRK